MAGRTWALRVAAVASWIDGVGFGVFAPYAIWSLAAGRGVPLVAGYPTYGGGPFERLGVPSSVPLVLLFLLVCLLEIAAGVLLWRLRPSGAVLALVLLVPGAVFWWGFALPAGPILAVLRTALIAWGWPALRR